MSKHDHHIAYRLPQLIFAKVQRQLGKGYNIVIFVFVLTKRQVTVNVIHTKALPGVVV